jgi:hypothetical protein
VMRDSGVDISSSQYGSEADPILQLLRFAML